MQAVLLVIGSEPPRPLSVSRVDFTMEHRRVADLQPVSPQLVPSLLSFLEPRADILPLSSLPTRRDTPLLPTNRLDFLPLSSLS